MLSATLSRSHYPACVHGGRMSLLSAGCACRVWILFQDDSHWYCFTLRFLKLIFVDVNFVQQNALAINYFI